MDFGKFLGYLGNLFFGGGQKKKEDENQPTVQRPVSLLPQQPQQQSPVSIQNPAAPLTDLMKPKTAQPPRLGGVTLNQSQQPNPKDVEQAKRIIDQGGAGAPLAPSVIAAAKKPIATPQSGPIPEKQDSPIESYAKTFYGGVNNAGSLVGSLIGSLLPFGEANVYSDKGRQNLVRDLQNETINPNTGELFTTGRQAVEKLERDATTRNTEALAGDLGTTLINALSFIPAERLFKIGAEAAGASGATKIIPEILKGGAIGGGFGAASGATQAMQQNATAPEVAQSAIAGFGPAAVLGGLVPGAAGAYGQVRQRIGGVPQPQSPQVSGPTTLSTRVEKPQAIMSRNQTQPQPQPQQRPQPTLVNGVDQRIVESNTRADQMIQRANEALSTEGSSYAQVVRKLYNNSRPDGTVVQLTPNERVVAETIQPQLTEILDRMNRMGLTDSDTGLIRDYLPTTRFDENGGVQTLADVEGQDFGFTRRRGGRLSDKEVEQGAEQALKNYLGTGSLLEDITPETVSKVKLSRKDKEFLDLLESDNTGADTGIRANDQDIVSARTINQKVIDAENAQKAAEKRVSGGDNSDEAIAAQAKAQEAANDARIEKQISDYTTLERKTDEQIRAINESADLTPADKKQRINQLESHLSDVRNQTYYLQSGVRTNLLLGVGRVADQANKGIQAVNDKITGLARRGANAKFRQSTGRDLFASNNVTSKVWKQVRANPALQQAKNSARIAAGVVEKQNEGKGFLSNLYGGYRLAGTRLTEAGSRYRVAAKDTVSYFVSKAQSEGITSPKEIAQYVQDSIGSAEFKRVQNAMFEARNTFTGLPTSGNVKTNKAFKLDLEKAIYNGLGSVPGLSREARQNLADGLSIPIVGFPRLLFRLGARGFDNATFGLPSFFKAAKISPKNEAEALRKGLLFQQALRSAQNGAGLGAFGFALGASGMTTGAYPSDPNERARWEKDRIQPFSIKVGDQYVDIGRYAGPIAFPLMIGAAIGRGEAQNIPATVGEVTKQFLANYGADSVGDVLSTAGSLLKGDFEGAAKDTNRWLAGVAGAFVPASSLLGTAGKATDIVQDKAAPDGGGSVIDAFRARFPGIREGLPEKTDSLGNPITQGTPANLLPGVYGGQSSTKGGQSPVGSGVEDEINRLASLKFEVMPSRDVENKNSQNDAKLLLDSPLYQSASDEQKAEYMKDALSGSKTKDINKGLPEVARKALVQYQLQSEDARKAWLDDLNNAADYYQAEYDNLKTSGKLTAKDDNLQEKSGLKYKAAVAKVNRDLNADTALQSLYDQVSESDFKKMLDPSKEEYDLDTATRLYQYDQARTKAKVSGNKFTDKPKYGGTAKGKGGAGSGSRGSKKFGFASLPASLVGVKSGGAGGGAYSKTAPLYKPIADLKSAPISEIPKGRTISIKRGVSL